MLEQEERTKVVNNAHQTEVNNLRVSINQELQKEFDVKLKSVWEKFKEELEQLK